MIGDPSIDMSMMPPQERRTRTRESAGYHRLARFGDMFHRGKIAALSVAVVAVDIATKDKTSLVRLGYVEMSGTKGHDAIDEGL